MGKNLPFERLKNDLYERLLNLASNFQTEITEGLSLSVQRLIRENIVIQTELTQIFDESVSKKTSINELGGTTEMYYNQIEENRKQTLRRIITCKIQASLLHFLKTSHAKLKSRLADLKLYSQNYRRDHRQCLEKLQMEEEKLDFRRRQLEVILHQAQVKENSALNKKNQSRYMIKKLKQILYDIKLAVYSALKIFGSDEEIEKMTFNQLLFYLMNKMIMNKSEAWIAPINSTATIFSTDIVYQTGDLGFDPQLKSSFPEETKPSFRHGLEILKQWETKSSSIILEIAKMNLEKKEILFEAMAGRLEAFDDLKISTSDEEHEEEIESKDDRRQETDCTDEMKFIDEKEDDDEEF